MASLSQQLVELNRLAPDTLLEIGKGSGFVSDFIRKAGIEVTTFDINPALEPDVVGSIDNLVEQFGNDSFDCVVCAEVLEHLPFEKFEFYLDQLRSVCRRGCVVTLPRCDHPWFEFRLMVRLPGLWPREIYMRMPKPGAARTIYAGHHWEINSTPGTSLKQVRETIKRYFTITEDYRLRAYNRHHFFILRA